MVWLLAQRKPCPEGHGVEKSLRVVLWGSPDQGALEAVCSAASVSGQQASFFSEHSDEVWVASLETVSTTACACSGAGMSEQLEASPQAGAPSAAQHAGSSAETLVTAAVVCAVRGQQASAFSVEQDMASVSVLMAAGMTLAAARSVGQTPEGQPVVIQL